jgi:hypothetical protein
MDATSAERRPPLVDTSRGDGSTVPTIPLPPRFGAMPVVVPGAPLGVGEDNDAVRRLLETGTR